MGYKSEEKFIDIVEKCLVENGCKTWREVIPDNCKKWDKPYRVDLIFYRDDFGYIGAEGKNINTLGQGGVISGAVDQIQNKYRNQTYFNGNFIEKWCLLVPTEASQYNKNSMDRVVVFLRHFLKKRYNILLLEYKPGGRNYDNKIVINALCKDSIKIGYDNNIKKEMTLFGGGVAYVED